MPHGPINGDDGRLRCRWAEGHADLRAYHDEEWGIPVADDERLFEEICLAGFQSGLSWLTILRKRDNFRTAFADFDFARIAGFGPRDIERLMADAGIVRHRGKIESAINNARRACDLAEECGSLGAFFWKWEPPAHPPQRPLPAKTPESTALSKELKKRGWSFVGPTTAYAFMQAMGMVNDHLDGCFARAAVERARAAFERPK